MAFTKGHGGGRPKGCKNKVSRYSKEKIAEFLTENWETFVDDYEHIVDRKERAKIYLELIPYVVPKCQSVAISELPKELSFKDELTELAEE